MKTLKLLYRITPALFLASTFYALWDWSSLGLKLMGTTFLIWWIVTYYKGEAEKKQNFAERVEREIMNKMRER